MHGSNIDQSYIYFTDNENFCLMSVSEYGENPLVPQKFSYEYLNPENLILGKVFYYDGTYMIVYKREDLENFKYKHQCVIYEIRQYGKR